MRKHMIALLCAVTLLLNMAVAPALAAETQYPISVEEYTEGSFDELRIKKVYQLSLSDDPAGIPTEDFERNGYTFHLLDLIRADEVGVDTQTHTETITMDSTTGELSEVLKQLEGQKDFTTKDGYSGVLLLDHTSVKVEVKGYNSKTSKPAVVQSVTRKDKSEGPPKLYDLTTLQREANRLFDYTAQQTLDYLQSLYEKRLATYPRTDSRYLTEDMAEGLPALCQTVAGALSFMVGQPLPVNAAQVVDSDKVTDHHAVIPTAEITKADLAALPTGERNILHLIAARLLCAVGEPYTYAETAVTLECGGASFSTKGRTVTAAGWKGLERAFLSTLKQKPKQEAPPPALPELAEGQRFEGVDAILKQHPTAPPARFTEDTLLSAMEHASAEDFAALESVERTGLGTPATRADTIEKLVRSGFVERRKKQLVPTEKGLALSNAMPDQLKSAKLTAEWEDRLGAVERGELAPEDFMVGITVMLSDLVKSYQNVSVTSPALSQSGRTVIGKCPRCGKNVVEGKKSFYCEGYHNTPSCGFALWKNDRFFTSKRKELTKIIAASLLKNGRISVSDLYSEKKGVLYDATVVLDDDGGKYVRFKLEFDNKTNGRKGK